MGGARDTALAAGRLWPLPTPALGSSAPLARVLAARRSRRQLSGRALSEAEIGALAWAAQGVTSREGGRAAPSAGALYPVTLTVVEELATWRYLPSAHALAPVRPGDARPRLASAALGQECVASAAIVLGVTARPAVLEARYGGRAERYCALEAGHVAQNVLLVATALGLAAVPVAAFDDDAVLAALALGREHLPLYLVPVGAPAGEGA